MNSLFCLCVFVCVCVCVCMYVRVCMFVFIPLRRPNLFYISWIFRFWCESEPIYWAQYTLIIMCWARNFFCSFMNPELWDCVIALLRSHSGLYVMPRRMMFGGKFSIVPCEDPFYGLLCQVEVLNNT